MTEATRRPMVVIVTGLSGAGRTTALRALEDLGFFCIDNLPTVLAPDAVALCEKGGMTRVALGMDVRVRVFLGEVGRMKYLKPLYSALWSRDDSKDLAKEIFAATGASYHPIARGGIERILAG